MPADQQGAAMLVETFAQYSALLVMEQHYGKEQVRRFLKYELDRYLRSRGGQVLDELPLDRVEDQDYIYYRKGSVAMYWAKEALGEQVVNRAMQRLLAQFALKGPPYANTNDFLKLLREEAGPQNDALITDLFDRIVLLDLRASDAVATKRPDGKYDVKFNVEARKLVSDGAGTETEVPMDEKVEIGAFSAKPGDAGFGQSSVLWQAEIPIRPEFQAAANKAPVAMAPPRWVSPFWNPHQRHVGPGVSVTMPPLDQRPAWVGIDPYNKRIDRNSDDNLTQVGLPR